MLQVRPPLFLSFAAMSYYRATKIGNVARLVDVAASLMQRCGKDAKKVGNTRAQPAGIWARVDRRLHDHRINFHRLTCNNHRPRARALQCQPC